MSLLSRIFPQKAKIPGRVQRGAAYMRGEMSSFFAGWAPQMRDAKIDVAEGWARATARTVDLLQNSGWIAGLVDQATANTIGQGLRLNAVPDFGSLGWTEKDASEWALRVEKRWELWAGRPLECDVTGQSSFGKLQAQAFKSWFATGEIVSEIPWRERPGGQYGTKVRMIAPHRLAQTTDTLAGVYQGVRMDTDGFPLGYRILKETAVMGNVEIDIPAMDRFGRRRMVHVYDGVIGQVRGISPLTPALRVARQFDQLADATLTAAMIQAIFAATVESDGATDQVLAGLQDIAEQEATGTGEEASNIFTSLMRAKEDWYQNTKIDLGTSGRIAHLMPGEKLKFNRSEHPNSEFKNFALFLLRELARCAGVTFEAATGDYQGATYSSVRIATSEIFGVTLRRRADIIAPWCQPHYEAWLEEEIDRGWTPYPGGIDAFVAQRGAAARAQWKGPPKPQADDLKTAKAHDTWKRLGVISDETICNELGIDVEDLYAQLKREQDMREAFGLRDPVAQELPADEQEADPTSEED